MRVISVTFKIGETLLKNCERVKKTMSNQCHVRKQVSKIKATAAFFYFFHSPNAVLLSYNIDINMNISLRSLGIDIESIGPLSPPFQNLSSYFHHFNQVLISLFPFFSFMLRGAHP